MQSLRFFAQKNNNIKTQASRNVCMNFFVQNLILYIPAEQLRLLPEVTFQKEEYNPFMFKLINAHIQYHTVFVKNNNMGCISGEPFKRPWQPSVLSDANMYLDIHVQLFLLCFIGYFTYFGCHSKSMESKKEQD